MPRRTNKTRRGGGTNGRMDYPPTSAKSFPLSSLPIELLDLILSYVVVIPWHPKNGVYMKKALRDLFGPTLHVNRKIRQLTIDIIMRDTLWIQVVFRSRIIHSKFKFLVDILPILPLIYRRLLPENIPGIAVSIGKAPAANSSQISKKARDTLIFPFNISSFTRLYGQVLKVHNLPEITVNLTAVPAHHRNVVNHQIRPIVNRLPLHLPARFIDYDGSQTDSTATDVESTYVSAIHKLDALVSHIRELDQTGRQLEASFLALLLGPGLRQTIFPGDSLVSTVLWTRDLVSNDYLSRPGNLERMRIVRSLHHIAYRACMAYLTSAEKQAYHLGEGDNESDSDFHEIRCEEDQHKDWLRSNYGPEWYGLPDHEFAELYYMRARLYAHEEETARLRIASGTYPKKLGILGTRQELALQAVRHAYVAWRLDTSNVMYATLFKRMVERYSDQAMRLLRQYAGESTVRERSRLLSGDEMETVVYLDVYGHPRIHGGTPDVVCGNVYDSSDWLEYMWRAREVAKQADVTYDARRGEELSKLEYGGEDEKEVLKNLLGDCDRESGKGLRFDRFGVTDEDFRAFEEKERRERDMLERWGTLR